jgi:hypothetical protein
MVLNYAYEAAHSVYIKYDCNTTVAQTYLGDKLLGQTEVSRIRTGLIM